jgi:hypothetical protein
MYSFSNPRHHLQFPRIDLRSLVRDVVIVVAVGLSAAVVTASERTVVQGAESAGEESAHVANEPLAVEVVVGAVGASAIVHGLDSSAVNTVSLVNGQGEAVVARSLTVSAIRFDDVPAGRYHIVVSSEGPITHVDSATISSAIVVRSDAFSLATVGDVVLEPR